MGNTAKKDARTASALERDEKALLLRKDGLTYDEIAKKLHYGARCHAYRAVKKRIQARQRDCDEAADEVRVLELARLDAMLQGLWKKASAGDPQAIDRVLRIQERRSAYLGLDSPRLLKIELERELSAHLEKLRTGLPGDVYEQVLAVIAGEPGAAPPVSAPVGADPEGDDGAD